MNDLAPEYDDAGYSASYDEALEVKPTNPIVYVHRKLRGRYRYALPLALILAIPAGMAGFFAVKPTYDSVGMIQVLPSRSRLLYSTEENEVIPLFESFMKAQESFLRSRRVLDLAVSDPKLIQAGWPAGPSGVALLQRKLSIRRASQILQVSVNSQEPAAAQAAVNAVLAAYQEIYGEQGELSVSQKERQLVEREATLDRELQGLRERIFQIADEYGSDTLDRLHASRVSEMERLDAELSNLNFLIANAQQRVEAMGAEGGADVAPIDSAQQFAELDPQLASLLREELRLNARAESLAENYGPNHRDMKRIRNQITEVRNAIDLRTEAMLTGGGPSDPASLAAADPAVALEQLESRKAQYEALVDRTRREAITLGRKRLQISSLTEQANEKKTLLDDTRRRLESIRVESRHSETGRVNIAQRGDLPVSPSNDRRLPLAVAGAGMGAVLGFGVFFLVGYRKDGYRYIDELADVDGAVPLLGTLPDLSGGDIESDELAALSVHHLRNVLQLRDGRKDKVVYTITSATSGDGKTSLALALGMSFALSGRKTLLLDSDLVGRGLTHELGLDGEPGLCQTIDAGVLSEEIHETRVKNLWALPSGDTTHFEPERLSHRNLSVLFAELRGQFDTILVDTGPLLGSLEANLVSVLSDGVVLTISRGRSPKLVDASIERLRRLNARCAGLVFNKATPTDIERSVSHFSFCSQSLRSQANQDREIGRGRSGLLVQAVRSGGKPELPDTTPASKAS